MLDVGEVFLFLHSYITRCMMAFHIKCLTHLTRHVMHNELVAKVLEYNSEA